MLTDRGWFFLLSLGGQAEAGRALGSPAQALCTAVRQGWGPPALQTEFVSLVPPLSRWVSVGKLLMLSEPLFLIP